MRLVPIEEFVASDLEVPPSLVENILPFNGIGMLFAKEGQHKSQLVMTLAASIVDGRSFLGTYETFGKKVAYLSFDMPKIQFQDRAARAMPRINNKDNLHILAHDSPIDLLRVSDDTDWVKQINEFSPDLIIWDTLHKIHILNENDAQTPAVLYKKLNETFNFPITHLLVHHEGKDSPNPDYWRPEEQRARGSSAWLADADLGMRTQKDRKSGSITVSFPRVRWCEEQEAIVCKLNTETLMLEPKEGEMSAKEVAIKLAAEEPDLIKEDFIHELKKRKKMTDRYANMLANEVWKTRK